MKEELIINYLEGNCSKEELALVNKLINEDAAFREEIELQQTMDISLSEGFLLEPAPSFANQVMGKLTDPKFFVSNFMFYLLGLIFLQAIYFSAQYFDFFPTEYGVNSTYLMYGMLATFFLIGIESANTYLAAR